MRRTAQVIEERNSQRTAKKGRPKGAKDKKKRTVKPESLANIKPYEYHKGQSGNPGGRPEDVAAKIARRIFEQNEEAIYLGMAKGAIGGKAYDFDVLATRAYGKKTTVEHTGADGEPLSVTVRFVKGTLKEMK